MPVKKHRRMSEFPFKTLLIRPTVPSYYSNGTSVVDKE